MLWKRCCNIKLLAGYSWCHIMVIFVDAFTMAVSKIIYRAQPVKVLQSVDISVEKLNWSTKFQLNGASMRRPVPLRLLDMIPAPQAPAGVCTIEKLHILKGDKEHFRIASRHNWSSIKPSKIVWNLLLTLFSKCNNINRLTLGWNG